MKKVLTVLIIALFLFPQPIRAQTDGNQSPFNDRNQAINRGEEINSDNDGQMKIFRRFGCRSGVI